MKLPYFLLIEGAPGIGKTVLSKEIAHQWAKNTLLKFKRLVFLLSLQDPKIKQIQTLESLIQYLFKSTEMVSRLSQYLYESKGKDLVFIFDGYDELSEEDRNNSLVAKVIGRDELPKCDLVVTSRPSASLSLRNMADCIVEVLGFTEKDRLDYIQHALEGSDNKIKALKHYLQSNCTINALCYVPLNMTILLCLFEEINSLPRNISDLDSIEKFGLPNTQTEMYEKFILMTITRFLKKQNKPFPGKCLKISQLQLPEPYDKVFNELLYLAYYALTKDNIVFSLNDEIVQACPFLKSNYWDGLDLLKVTEYMSNASFHFLHFSIQEYLAAYYIALQPYRFQFDLLRDTFWEVRYFNTWIMYVDITGGKKEAWKNFISGNRFTLLTKMFKPSEISKSYLNDKIKSLYLFQCFAEIGNKELAFKDKRIDLSNQTLLPKDISTICFLLSRSVNKHWLKLDLSYCNIGDTGSDILCKKFLDNSRDIVSIDKVDLSHNQLQVHSMLGILDVVKIWHTSETIVYENCLKYDNLFELCLNKFSLYTDEDFPQRVFIGPFVFAHNIDMCDKLIKLPNIITGLYLNYSKYPSTNFTYEELSDKLNLSKLHIIGANIRSYFIGAMVKKVKKVGSVYIYDHTLSDEDVKYISLMLHKMKSSNLGVWVVIGRTKILGNIPDMFALNRQFSPVEISNLTESIRRLCSSSNMSTTKFNRCIECKTVSEDFFYVLHKNISKCEIKLCLLKNNILIANGVKYGKISKELSSNNKLISIFIMKCKLNTAELANSISKQESLEQLYIFDSSLEFHGFKCENLLTQTLKELFIHNTDTDSSCTLNIDLLEAQRLHSNISILLITNNVLIGHNPTCEQILLSLRLEENLTVWKICSFPTNIEMFQQITNTLSNVVELDITGCNLGECEPQYCDNQYNLVPHSYYRISKQTIDSICRLLSYFTELKTLSLCHSDLQEAGAGKIFEDLSISNLTKLNISHNEINEQAVDDIAKVLSQISKLEELNLSYNNLQVTETVKLLNEVQNRSGFSRLNFSNNRLDDKAAHGIATFFSHNPQLKELDLECNDLQAASAIVISNGMNNLQSLTKLNISNNDISSEAANDIAVALFQNKSLEELDFSYNNLGALGSLHIIHNMEKMSNLVKLNVCSIGITEIAADDIATVLNNNNKLEELDLSHNDIKTTGATVIFKKTSIVNLHKFNMSHNNITDDVEYIETFLSMNTELEELDLCHNHLQAAIIKICKTNLTKLTGFNISHNNILCGSANDIGAFLSHNTKLQTIDLSGNDLQELGYGSVFKSLQFISSNLSSLKISHSNVINRAADELAMLLLHNTSLQEFDLSYTNLSTLDVVKIFNRMRNILNLKTINISHNMITDQAADMLANVLLQNIKLKDINLSYNNLSSSGTVSIFKGMKNVSNLETIDISHNMITDEAAENVATVLYHNYKLKSLDLSSNYFTSEGLRKIFDCLKNAMYLRKLNINCNEITAKAADTIAMVLSHNSKLRELDLGNNFMQTASAVIIFNSLRHISNLKKLRINGNMITDEAADDIAAVLSQSTELEELDISCNNLQTAGTIKIFESIKHTRTLTKLSIADNMVTDEATVYIVDVLLNNSNLKELNLGHIYLKNTSYASLPLANLKLANLSKFNFSSNNINEKLANYISSFLSHCTNLTVLDLSCTNLQTSGCIQMLNRLDIINLTTFNISGNGITTHVADKIGALLSKTDKLQELDLSYNNLQESGIRKILNSVKNISNLCSLNISNNYIAGDLKYVTEILIGATKLLQLDLSYNQLKSDYMICFFYQMKSIFTNIIQLCVSGNVISAEVTEALADVLLENTTLKELDLSDNNLHAEGINNIFGRLKISTLFKLNISHNDITEQAADCIATFLSVNTDLEELDLSHTNLPSAGAVKICATDLANLTAFNISHNVITGEAANDIATFLSRNTKLKKLDLSHNNLLSAGAIKIFKTGISKLTKFNISHNSITIEAANDMETFLSCNTKLHVLDLSCNDLQESGCMNVFAVLQNSSVLTSLKFSNCNVSNKAADELATVLLHNVSLQELDLSYNNLSKSDSLKILKGMKDISGLLTFNVSHNKFTDEVADELAISLLNKIKLHEIDLSYNNLSTSDTVKIFKGMKNISNLGAINISHNTITDEAADSIASVLSNNTNLLTLNMSFNCLRSKGWLEIFDGMKSILYLRNLNISHNKIALEATGKIAAVLSHNTKLEELDISNNDLQTSGAMKIFQSIKHTSTLTKLNIAHNMITDEATEYIIDVLYSNSELKEFNISHNSLLEIDIITKIIISRMIKVNKSIDEQTTNKLSIFVTSLQELNLSNVNLQMVDAIKSFKDLNNISALKIFNISGNSLPLHAADYLAEFLSKNRELQELDLSHNDLQESGISKILGAIKCSNLTKLNISKNNANLKGTVEVLSCSTELVELNLSYNKLNSAVDATWFFSESKNIFGNLATFNMSSICHEINDEAATALANVFSQNSKLKELDLSDNNLSTEAIIKIMGELNTSTLLTRFIISHNNVTDQAADYIATFLSRNTNLKVLDLSHNQLLSAGAIKVCKTKILKLVTFKMNHNSITAEAANDIASFLSHNKNLQVLDLSCNDLKGSGCKNILKALDICNLTSLKIGNCHATDEAADEVANVLLNNPTLQELDLSCNKISKCFLNIFKGMKNISNLVSINVSHNTITDEAVDDIVYVFLHNTSLRVLDLSYNNLSTLDTAKIFEGMKNISKLEAIDISHNAITDEAVDSIAAVLFHNSNLQVLNVSFSCLDSEGCIKIFNGMKNTWCLRNLDISNNKISCEASENIATVLSQNTKMEMFDISYNNLQTPGAIKIFQGIKYTSTLTKFNIAHNMISDDATNHILDILCNSSKLKEFNLSHNNLLEIDVIKKLIVSKFDNLIDEQAASKLSIIITSLQKLDLSNINLLTEGAQDFEELGNISILAKFDVSGNSLTANNLAKFLSKNNDLQEINLSQNNLQVAGIKTILSEIKISNLTTLNISANNVNLSETAEVLSFATNLTELNLSYNKLNNAADAAWFFSMLKSVFINLIKLNISCICHEIDEEAAKELANIFSHNNRLNELDLSDNNLCARAASKIFDGLNISTLSKFNISHNMITDEVADSIIDFLSKCTKLKLLDLSYNSFQDDGIIKICDSIILCSANLISVDFRYNSITTTAANVIEFYLSYIKCLKLRINV